MKKQDLPQDKSALDNFTREVCYVKNEAGNYETDLSTGWEAKKVALDNAWDDINDRIKEAQHNVRAGKSSPIAFFMEEKLIQYRLHPKQETGGKKVDMQKYIQMNLDLLNNQMHFDNYADLKYILNYKSFFNKSL